MGLLIELYRKFFLHEATCPECGNQDAYVGLNDVECPNKKCKHFSPNMVAQKSGVKPAISDLLKKLKLYGGGSVFENWGWPYDKAEHLKKKMKEFGMEEIADDPFGGYYSPEHWELWENVPPPNEPYIDISHYEETYLVPKSAEAKNIVKKSPDLSNGSWSDHYYGSPNLNDPNAHAPDELWDGQLTDDESKYLFDVPDDYDDDYY